MRSTYATAEALQQVLDPGVIEGASSAINQIDHVLAGGYSAAGRLIVVSAGDRGWRPGRGARP